MTKRDVITLDIPESTAFAALEMLEAKLSPEDFKSLMEQLDDGQTATIKITTSGNPDWKWMASVVKRLPLAE